MKLLKNFFLENCRFRLDFVKIFEFSWNLKKKKYKTSFRYNNMGLFKKRQRNVKKTGLARSMKNHKKLMNKLKKQGADGDDIDMQQEVGELFYSQHLTSITHLKNEFYSAYFCIAYLVIFLNAPFGQ